MREISKLILKDYQVRKTRKQKDEFIYLLQDKLNNEHIIVDQTGLFKSRNIIIGDLQKAEYVLSAHYDTAPVLPFPNFLTPKNLLIYILFNIVLFIAFFFISGVISFLSNVVIPNEIIASLINLIVVWFLIGWMFFGKANKHTANDNTSGVITLLELMEKDEIKDKVCFVFFDQEELGLLGSSAFKKKYKNIMNNKLLINFDCVSDGDYMMFITSKSAKCYQDKIKQSFYYSDKEVIVTESHNTIYPSDQKNFKHHIGVASFHKNKWIGYYIDKIHTSKDICFDEKNIEMLVEGIKRFVK